MAWDTPTYSLKVQISFSSLHASLQNGDLENACRALTGFWLVTCRQVPGTLPAH